MKVLIAAWLTLIASLLTGPVSAQTAGRLDKIRETGVITLGHPQTSVPFAYLDASQKPAGYMLEICEHVAAKLKASLNLAKLDIRYAAVTSATRIPLIGNGTIDLECGTTTNLPARHEFVAFSPSVFVAQAILLARKDGGVDVNDPASFRGKSIAAQAGGEDFKVISQVNAKENLGITIIPTNDNAQTFMMVQSGRAAASCTDDAMAYATVATSKQPEDFVIGTRSFLAGPYGIVEPKDDPAFKTAVDGAVISLIKDGTVAALYQKYFESAVLPGGLNLKFPMSAALRHALDHPTDSANPEDYK